VTYQNGGRRSPTWTASSTRTTATPTAPAATWRTPAARPVFDEVYQYDSLDRLTQAQRGTLSGGAITNVVWTQSFGLDALGNWDSVTGEAPGRSHNRRNQITGRNGTAWSNGDYYDANGNLKKDERGYKLEYDAWDRLVRVRNASNAIVAEYTYDGRGYRVQKITPDGTVVDYYYSEDWQVVEERTSTGGGGGSGTTTATYVWGTGYVDGLVARETPAHGRQYALYDANFNVTSLISSSGIVQERYVYDPYGAVSYKTGSWGNLSASQYGQVYLFQGLRWDAATGAYHARHRDLSPVLGRWLQPDPLGYVDGSNAYLAHLSDPLRYVDPAGLKSWIDVAFDSITFAPVDVLIPQSAWDAVPESFHFGLDIFGIGDITPCSDLLNAKLYAKKGRKLDTAISVAGIVPYAGDSAKTVRLCARVPRPVARQHLCPNPHGSRGSPEHQQRIADRIDELTAQGHTHTHGGSLPEEIVKTPGGHKEYRRPDITTTDPSGKTNRENVGRTTKCGDPVARETRALDDIEAARGERPGYTGYDR
jgi:RHS repeat-associated protein